MYREKAVCHQVMLLASAYSNIRLIEQKKLKIAFYASWQYNNYSEKWLFNHINKASQSKEMGY